MSEREFGRPDTLEALPQDTAALQKVAEIESYLYWLQSDIWGHNSKGRLKRVEKIKELLDEIAGV